MEEIIERLDRIESEIKKLNAKFEKISNVENNNLIAINDNIKMWISHSLQSILAEINKGK